MVILFTHAYIIRNTEHQLRVNCLIVTDLFTTNVDVLYLLIADKVFLTKKNFIIV